MSKFPLPPNSLMFAPMEGITDEHYRNVVMELYPEWDSFTCDFLRVPNPSPYPRKHLIKHIGESIFHSNKMEKTIYQILTSPGAYTQKTVEDLADLGVTWLDLNLGCPSKTVCKNQGGSFLLSELEKLKKIIQTIRKHFPHTFTCKIRVGYKDDSQFLDILKLLEDEGADAITIHARTRDELYKGVAKWEYVKKAVEHTTVPIIGNGDIWNTDDIKRYFEFTRCHSIMLARSALKTPWLARLYKNQEQETPELRIQEIKKYFQNFYDETQKQNFAEASRIKRIKSLCRYLFEDLHEGDLLRKKILLSKSFEEQMLALENYKPTVFVNT